MKLIFAVAMAAMLIGPAQAQDEPDIANMSAEQIVEQADGLHPAALYVLAARLLAEGEGQQAANWMYAGQLRYRFMIAALGEASRDERILFGALTEQVGRPVNEYIGGDPDDWIAAMQWALDWDAATDNPTTSKAEHAATLEEVRSGLESLIVQVDTSREEIREQREANGLPNRW